MNNQQSELIKTWDEDLRIICHAHYEASVRILRRNYILGIPVVILTALIGTSVFITLNINPEIWARVLAGSASLLATLLASLQTFMKYSERAEKHREAGARFGAFLKEIEQIHAIPPATDEDFMNWGNQFRARWDAVSLQSPTVPSKIWQRHHRIYRPTNK